MDINNLLSLKDEFPDEFNQKLKLHYEAMKNKLSQVKQEAKDFKNKYRLSDERLRIQIDKYDKLVANYNKSESKRLLLQDIVNHEGGGTGAAQKGTCLLFLISCLWYHQILWLDLKIFI